jgi:hypothetical protein
MNIETYEMGFSTNAEREDWYNNTATHELGHIKSENETQGTFKLWSCEEGVLGGAYACLYSDAHLASFYNEFWEDIIDEFNQTTPVDYYNEHTDDFVNGAASINFGEDFASTFEVFVEEDTQRTGSRLQDQKINFFYAIPEMVALRDAIRQNL